MSGVSSPYLAGRDRYERVMEGWVDNTHDDVFTLTAQVRDDDLDVQVSLVTLPSPCYEIREARALVFQGRADPENRGRI